MAGLIRREDVDEVRSRTRIDDVVGEYVTLKTAGVGSLKGLCPFHDERTPSFTVRPAVGRYHCFGCGESGDVYAFVMGMEHLSFAETVQRLASRIGYQLRYEDGGGPDNAETGRRKRLLDANAAAQEFFRGQLQSPAAQPGRVFLTDRGFDRGAAEHFGVGFAPSGWDGLLSHLRGRGFTDAEIADAGLTSTSGRGPYDRFRGRLTWPIRDITGSVVGFGARRLLEGDQGPKYLNTPQTRIYNKSQVLYGLDLAKRDIGKQRQVVIVEGYTDVMAMHLAGITRAVATCGTAFGAEHIKVLRRLLMDDDAAAGQIVFTFDGDEAGRNAALRAFGDEQRFVAQTYVAVQPDGYDPCELRQRRGDQAVAQLIESKQPLFTFVLRATLARHDLELAEGRAAALRQCAPVIAGIKDPTLRPDYTRQLAGWLGMEIDQVHRAVRSAGTHRPTRRGPARGEAPPAPAAEPDSAMPRPDPRDPVIRAEQQLLGLALQHPAVLQPYVNGQSQVSAHAFASPAHQHLWSAICATAAQEPMGDWSRGDWVAAVHEQAGDVGRGLIDELAVADLPLRSGEDAQALATRLVMDARHRHLLRREVELRGRAQRLDAAGDPEASAVFAELFEVTRQRQELLREDGR